MSEDISFSEALAQFIPPEEQRTLIPQPHRFPLRIYHREGIDEPTIQDLMGMNEKSGHFSDILAYLSLSYHDQKASVLRKINEQVLAREPALARYEDAWPISAYLRSFMKSPLRNDTPAPQKRSIKDRSASPASPVRTRYPKTNRMSVVVTHSVASTSANSHSQENEEPIILSPTQPQGPNQEGESVSEHGLGQHDVICDLSPLSSYTSTPSMNFLSCALSPAEESSDGLRGPAPAAPLPAQGADIPEIVALLLQFALPLSDAEHIAGVLASLGIRDKAYLRVLSRLSSRDQWLVELQETGKLTEIQVRVVREIIENIVAENS
ncbi:hypothetical protein PYCCODRAFT_1475455 [Trametes coccinea BRFM310]|uniref:Uncharacterized protein n=1 Tax=Trametes coccinea (strain BRFM310) TaxID=1353009 RepID=A0A1Y2IWC9_TRAC3|nr:hypothetical protein PYCCODRAFT_1475455 [Trametes coccinea BRFM310]